LTEDSIIDYAVYRVLKYNHKWSIFSEQVTITSTKQYSLLYS